MWTQLYQMARALHPGVKENELQAVAAAELHRQGSQWIHNIQMTSGTPGTSPPPHLSSDRVIQPGDMVFADLCTLFNGYHTCYRTLCCGEPSDQAKRVYDSAYQMLLAGIDKCRVGNTTADIVNAWPDFKHWGF